MSLLFQEQLNQPISLSGSFTGSFSGSINGFINSASYALTASYLEGYVSTSIYNIFTSSYYNDSASFDYRIDNIAVDTGSYSVPPIIVNVATTAVLPRSPFYDNGINGIGAFLSASISGTLGNIDGVTLMVGDNLLVKNQASQIQNGVYSIISTGSASTRYLLSRSISSDETSELDSQIVIPSFGTTNRGGIFAQTTNNPIIGTDNIIYSLQTNTLISQTSAGTQAIYQIPWYIASTRQLSKGSPNFKYINVTSGTTVTTSSLLLTGSFNISGSLNVTNGITGSLFGITTSASYALTASYLEGSIQSASFASTASYVLNSVSSSYALNSTTASYALSSPGGGGSTALSSIIAATTSSIINSGINTIEWQWNSLTSGIGLKLSSSSTSSVSNTQTLFSVNQSGINSNSNQTTYGAIFSNSKSGSGAINIAGHFEASGGFINTAVSAKSNGNTLILDNHSGTATNNISFRLNGTESAYVGHNTSGTGIFSIINKSGNQPMYLGHNNVPWLVLGNSSSNYLGINVIPIAPLHVGGVNGSNRAIRCAGLIESVSTLDNAFIHQRGVYFGRFGLNSSNNLTFGSGTTGLEAQLVISSVLNNVGIGATSPVASAKLEISSTTQGFLPSRMTTTQKNAITSPAEGLVVYDLTLHKLCVFTGTVWETITSL
jgi:hypothetical protein